MLKISLSNGYPTYWAGEVGKESKKTEEKYDQTPGPSCSKLTTSLVNDHRSLKFQT